MRDEFRTSLKQLTTLADVITVPSHAPFASSHLGAFIDTMAHLDSDEIDLMARYWHAKARSGDLQAFGVVDALEAKQRRRQSQPVAGRMAQTSS